MIAVFVSLLVLLPFAQITVHADTSWTSLGGLTTSSPAVTGVTDYNTGVHWRTDIVVRGSDNGVYHRYYTLAGGWSNWVSLNGFTVDQPAIAYAKYNYKDTLQVVVRGSDNGLYYKRFDISSATWDSSWTQMGPGATNWYTSSTPVLINAGPSSVDGSDNLLLFIRGTDNYLYYAMWHNAWSYAGKSWLMGQTTDMPAAMIATDIFDPFTGVPRVHLVVRGMDNGIYYINGTLFYLQYGIIDWSVRSDGSPAWEKLPGSTISAPALASRIDEYGYIHLIVRGSDNGVYHNAYEAEGGYSWTGWEKISGATNDRPALWASPGPVNALVLYLYVKGMDGVIYRQAGYHSNSLPTYQQWVWEDHWLNMQGSTPSAPGMGEGNLCVRGMNNVVYYTTGY